MATKLSFYTPGKIMLTGEYLVLYGARSIAFPLKLGQQMDVTAFEEVSDRIKWISEDTSGEFFEGYFDKATLDCVESNNEMSGNYVAEVLKGARQLNPHFLEAENLLQVHCIIEFSRNYGFGSSSSLICNIAKWAGIDALELNAAISKGSGYDVAVGQAGTPIIYQLVKGKPEYFKVDINYPFTDKLWLVYLGHKQSTASAISLFQPGEEVVLEKIKEINKLTDDILEKKTLTGFQKSMKKHEKCIASLLDRPRVKEQLFDDFNGQIKSLGAWGGDYVLAASEDEPQVVQTYFQSRGYETIFPLEELVVFDEVLND